MISYFFFNYIHLILIHCLSTCFCNQHPVNLLLHCFLCIFIKMITDNIDCLPDFLCKCVTLCFCIHHFFHNHFSANRNLWLKNVYWVGCVQLALFLCFGWKSSLNDFTQRCHLVEFLRVASQLARRLSTISFFQPKIATKAHSKKWCYKTTKYANIW